MTPHDILKALLMKYHGRLSHISEKDMQAIKTILRGLDGNKLKLFFEVCREVEMSVRAQKGTATKLKKNPSFFQDMRASRKG